MLTVVESQERALAGALAKRAELLDLLLTGRLEVNKVELGGRWICVGREFVQLGEAAEEP